MAGPAEHMVGASDGGARPVAKVGQAVSANPDHGGYATAKPGLCPKSS